MGPANGALTSRGIYMTGVPLAMRPKMSEDCSLPSPAKPHLARFHKGPGRLAFVHRNPDPDVLFF